MSAGLGSSELISTPPLAGGNQRNGGRPLSAESRMKNKPSKSPKSSANGSKGGIMKIFKKGKAKENGVVPVRPSCFNDDFVRRPEVPDSPSRGGTAGGPGAGRTGKGKEEHRSYGLWRSKVGGPPSLVRRASKVVGSSATAVAAVTEFIHGNKLSHSSSAKTEMPPGR